MMSIEPSTPSNVRGETPGEPNTAHDRLILPGGRIFGCVDRSEAARTLIDAGVPGVNHATGKQEIGAAYSAFLDKLRQDAGDRAVAEWMSKR